MGRYVEGSYQNKTDALNAVQRLREQGYTKDDIFLAANPEVRKTLPAGTEAQVSAEADGSDVGRDERTLWEKIKDAFTLDEYENRKDEDDLLTAWQDDLERGNIIVLVNDDRDTEMNDETESAPYPDTPTEGSVLGANRDSDLADSMEETTSIGTGEAGAAIQRAEADDIEASKNSDILPGQDGDAFHSEGLDAEYGDTILEKEGGVSGLHLDEERDPETRGVGGPADNIPANPDVPMDVNDTLNDSPIPSRKGPFGYNHPITEDVPAITEKVTDNAPIEQEGLNIDVDQHHIGTSEADDLNKHI